MPMSVIFTGSNALQTNKMSPKGGKIYMLTNVLAIVKPGTAVGTPVENPVWPFCTSPVFAIFNWLF